MDKIRQTALLILADVDEKGAYMNLLIDEKLKKEKKITVNVIFFY